MIRLFIFAIIRFFLVALVIYVVLTFIKGIIRALRLNFRQSQQYTERKNTPEAKEDYKDVKDANFVELPSKETDSKQDLHS
jgi:large-conductance mechanosensitive channel